MEGGRRGSTVCLLPPRLRGSGETPSPSTSPGQVTGRTPGAAGQRGGVTQSHPLARAGSGPLPRSPQVSVLPPESGPRGLRPQRLVESGPRAPLTWNPASPEGPRAAPPLPGGCGGLQATLWPLPAPTVSPAQKHSGLCGPGLVPQPQLHLRSRGALWWLMDPTSEAARDPPRAGPGPGLPPSPKLRGGEGPGGGPGVSGEGAHGRVTCSRVLLQTPRGRAARIPIFQRSQGLELERQKDLQGVNQDRGLQGLQAPVLLLGGGTVSGEACSLTAACPPLQGSSPGG